MRQNDTGEVLLSPAQNEGEAISRIEKLSRPFSAKLIVDGPMVRAVAA